ncbi:hypothetical protein WK25_22110 [Burkholderia latens]|nr:hypothetical protein WK25_22110 [Burkholderia latens]
MHAAGDRPVGPSRLDSSRRIAGTIAIRVRRVRSAASSLGHAAPAAVGPGMNCASGGASIRCARRPGGGRTRLGGVADS